MTLQSYVVPVCLFTIDGGSANIKELIGTAFFINNHGSFLTARHIVEGAQSKAREKGLRIGLVVKDDKGRSSKSIIIRKMDIEIAPEPYDIAFGQVTYECETSLLLQEIEVSEWQDVATFGYPINAVTPVLDSLHLNIRCHKGHIQRLTNPEDIPFGKHPSGFELNFLLSKGLSGSPLFVHKGPRDFVVGVCVSSIRSETIEDHYEEINEDGQIYRESKLSINEYGFAHDIRPLFDMKPAIYDGQSLSELSAK